MSHRTLLSLLVALAALTTACTSEWPREVDAALEADGEMPERPTPDDPHRAARLAGLREAPIPPDELVEPAGDQLIDRGVWTDLGASPSDGWSKNLIVVVDRIEATPDELVVEARLHNRGDGEVLVFYRPRDVLRLITKHGFTVPPAEVTVGWETGLELPSGESRAIIATFERPLVDTPIGLAISRFEDLPLRLDSSA